MEKARNGNPDKREDSVSEGSQWIDQGLQLDQGTGVLSQAAIAFEMAGDLSSSGKCGLYQKAAALYRRVAEADRKNSQGTSADATTWRTAVETDDQKIRSLQAKITDSKCQ